MISNINPVNKFHVHYFELSEQSNWYRHLFQENQQLQSIISVYGCCEPYRWRAHFNQMVYVCAWYLWTSKAIQGYDILRSFQLIMQIYISPRAVHSTKLTLFNKHDIFLFIFDSFFVSLSLSLFRSLFLFLFLSSSCYLFKNTSFYWEDIEREFISMNKNISVLWCVHDLNLIHSIMSIAEK